MDLVGSNGASMRVLHRYLLDVSVHARGVGWRRRLPAPTVQALLLGDHAVLILVRGDACRYERRAERRARAAVTRATAVHATRVSATSRRSRSHAARAAGFVAGEAAPTASTGRRIARLLLSAASCQRAQRDDLTCSCHGPRVHQPPTV